VELTRNPYWAGVVVLAWAFSSVPSAYVINEAQSRF